MNKSEVLVVRGEKVMLDAHAAEVYGVSTVTLLRAVRQHRARFPKEFMFRLNKDESKKIALRGGMVSRFIDQKRNPFVFTPNGFIMLSSVLKSKKADAFSVFIIRYLYGGYKNFGTGAGFSGTYLKSSKIS